ncbi:uncharacterized protein PSFLO_02517 [Pseudozyma flocculosa]|uniref:Uncharacterized protein n=1 Tax=Pseudozyma flocculosa TaxID=84751 RepID=A0A5C3EZ32_9BASI|nr:uncharacterized protein PSFLO_02517 [Pseudozyma flocculosa]
MALNSQVNRGEHKAMMVKFMMLMPNGCNQIVHHLVQGQARLFGALKTMCSSVMAYCCYNCGNNNCSNNKRYCPAKLCKLPEEGIEGLACFLTKAHHEHWAVLERHLDKAHFPLQTTNSLNSRNMCIYEELNVHTMAKAILFHPAISFFKSVCRLSPSTTLTVHHYNSTCSLPKEILLAFDPHAMYGRCDSALSTKLDGRPHEVMTVKYKTSHACSLLALGLGFHLQGRMWIGTCCLPGFC